MMETFIVNAITLFLLGVLLGVMTVLVRDAIEH